ncbi:hypothetical protein [Mycobacterium lacus]|nr:hypothetical protein [Mycobacterium lacus]
MRIAVIDHPFGGDVRAGIPPQGHETPAAGRWALSRTGPRRFGT